MIRSMVIFVPLAMANLLSVITTAFPSWALNLGAFGLCAYLVWRADVRQTHLITVIEDQQEKLEQKNRRLERLYSQNTEAFKGMTAALDRRPCLQNVQVVSDKKEGD